MIIEACWLCGNPTALKKVKLRSGKSSNINYCKKCNFEFFSHDNLELLSQNMLDKTRLESAGLQIPDITTDFRNGYNQGQEYIAEFITQEDAGHNILEIGCSWGYFLKCLKEYGCTPYGLEINPLRAKYVRETLSIPCEENIDSHILLKNRYKKIFIFYCLEYIKNPLSYIEKLLNLLESTGEIILITPNLNDVLKDVWKNKGYLNFFYDECSISYYSPEAITVLAEKISKKIKGIKSIISTEQGYSIFNHLYWYFNQKPLGGSKRVGGDILFEELAENLKERSFKLNNELNNFLNKIDREYKDIIKNNQYGNRIICRIQKY